MAKVIIDKAGIYTVANGDVVVIASSVSGNVTLNPDDLSKNSIEVVLESNTHQFSVTTGSPFFRPEMDVKFTVPTGTQAACVTLNAATSDNVTM